MKKISILLTCLSLGLVSLTACGPKKVIPTYEGMSIEKDEKEPNQGLRFDNPIPDDSSSGTGDIVPDLPDDDDDDDELDDDDDELEDDLDSDIEDLVDIEVITDEEVKYYVEPNETFNIAVHLNNPNEFEIQSFTLNGKKYANYMFEEGSTLETLLLKTTASEMSGYHEYTIDAIKYIDGEDIKDVKMEGDKTIKTGVTYTEAPSVELLKETIDIDKVTIEYKLNDKENIINDDARCYISDGKETMKYETLNKGKNVVKFNNLKMDTTYEYGVITTFDLVDGKDLHSEWLATELFHTKHGVNFLNVTADKESISFEAKKLRDDIVIESYDLYDALTNEKVATVPSEETKFNNVKSDSKYVVGCNYSYNYKEEKVNLTVKSNEVTTAKKELPTVELNISNVEKESFAYNIAVTDNDSVLKSITKLELLQGETVIDSIENEVANEGTYGNLLSNNDYVLRATYEYDLNNGKGVVVATSENTIHTVSKLAPTYKFVSMEAGVNKIDFAYEITDTDVTITNTKTVLLKNNEVIKTIEDKTGSFTELETNTKYTVKLVLTYDLNDGQGEQTLQDSRVITTKKVAIPAIEIGKVSVNGKTVEYSIRKIDFANVLTIHSVKLLNEMGETVLENTDGKTFGSFVDVASGNYTLLVDYSYDLNDGKGPVTGTLIENQIVVA